MFLNKLVRGFSASPGGSVTSASYQTSRRGFAAEGRDPDAVKVATLCYPICAATKAEAEDKAALIAKLPLEIDAITANITDERTYATWSQDYVPGGTDVAVADGGTGASTAAGAASPATSNAVVSKQSSESIRNVNGERGRMAVSRAACGRGKKRFYAGGFHACRPRWKSTSFREG